MVLPLRAADTCGEPKHRRRYAGAIPGQSGRSALGFFAPPSFFFLDWKIFKAQGVGVIGSGAPSGFVPGGAVSADVWWSSCDGGVAQGPDCFSYFLCRVLGVISKDLGVILMFHQVLLVCWPPN